MISILGDHVAATSKMAYFGPFGAKTAFSASSFLGAKF